VNIREITKRIRGTGEQTGYFRREEKNRKVGKISRNWRENG